MKKLRALRRAGQIAERDEREAPQVAEVARLSLAAHLLSCQPKNICSETERLCEWRFYLKITSYSRQWRWWQQVAVGGSREGEGEGEEKKELRFNLSVTSVPLTWRLHKNY